MPAKRIRKLKPGDYEFTYKTEMNKFFAGRVKKGKMTPEVYREVVFKDAAVPKI